MQIRRWRAPKDVPMNAIAGLKGVSLRSRIQGAQVMLMGEAQMNGEGAMATPRVDAHHGASNLNVDWEIVLLCCA
jgi:hypothetical protein